MTVELWAKRRWWVEPFLFVAFWTLLPMSRVLPASWIGKCLDGVGFVIGRWGVRIDVN